MTVADLLEGARNQLRAEDFDACIDAAALAHARATDDAMRATAAVLAARAFLGKGIPPDAILWLDPVIAADATNALARAYRGWAQRESDRLDLAQTDLDTAAATPGAPACAHYYRGLLLADRGRTDEAIAALGDAAPDAELGKAALVKRAELRLAAGDRDGAITDFRAAARNDERGAASRLMDLDAVGDDPAVVITAAYAARALDNEPKALAMIAPLLAGDTLSPELRARALRLRGLAANGVRDFAAAAEHYLAAAAATPDDANAQTELGFALWNVERNAEGAAALEKALALGQRDGRPEMWLGDMAYNDERWGDALDFYDRALVRKPRHGGVLWMRACTLGQLGREDDERAAMLEAAIAGRQDAKDWCSERDITPPPQHFANADVGMRYGNFWAADTNYRFAAEGWLAASRAPGDYAHRYAAMALSNACYAKSQTGDRAGAVELGARAVSLRPGFRDGWLNYANQLCGVGRLEDGVKAYERAEWCHPFYAGSHYGRADALRRLGRAEESLAALQRAAQIGYEDQGRDNDIHYRMARTYQALGRWSEARGEYEHLDNVGMMPDETPAMLEAIDAIATLAEEGAGEREAASYRRYGLVATSYPYENPYYALRIQLKEAPDAATRVAIARAGATQIASYAVEIEEQAWLWSDRFALVTITAPDTDTAEVFDLLAQIPDSLAEVCDIVEVVGLGAIGVNTEDAAEQWSIATQPVPDAGPELPRQPAFWVARIGDTTRFAPFAADEAANTAIDEAASAIATAAANQHAEAAMALAEAGELVVVPATEPEDAESAEAERPSRDFNTFKRSDDDWGAFAASGAGFMLRRFEGYYTGLDRITADGALHEVVPMLGNDPLLMRHIGSAIISNDGATILWATNLRYDVLRCDVATGQVTRLLEGLPQIGGIVLLDDDQVMVKTDKDVRIYAARDGGLALVALAPTELGPAVVWGGGKVVICGTVSEPEVVVFGWSHGMLARLAEITVDINCYSTSVNDNRVFLGGKSVRYELKNVDVAWKRFDAWAQERAAERAAATGLSAVSDATAPSPGIQEGPYEARNAVAWLCTGEAGIAFGLVAHGGGYRVVAADENGARAVKPSIVGPSFSWDWCFGQKGVVLANQGQAHEVDLVGGTSRPLATTGSVGRVVCARGGYVTTEDTELVVYAREGDELRETGRLDLEVEADELGVAEDGDVVFVRCGEYVAYMAVNVPEGALYAMGTLKLGDYFTAYLRGGGLYVQNTYEGSGTQLVRYRVNGLAAARAAAIAGGERLESFDIDAMEEGPVFGASSYDGKTEYNAKGESSDDDDDDDDDDEDDDDE